MVIIPITGVLIGLVIYPLIYSFWLSFHDVSIKHGALVWNFVGLENFSRIVNDSRVTAAFIRTAKFAAVAIPFSVMIALAAALILNESFKGRAVLRVVVLLPWAVSEYCTGVSWRWMLSGEYGLLNALLLHLGVLRSPMDFVNIDTAIYATALALAWHIAPLGAFFLLAGLQVIPEDLYRQAKIDGANALHRFWLITLPFIRYALLITIIISTIFTMAALDVIILLTNGGPGSASITATFIAYKETFRSLNLGYGAAISYLILVIVMILTIVYFKLLERRG